MLVTQPPTEIAEGLWMLGTGEYPIYLFHARGEAALFEGGTGAMGPLLEEQLAGLKIDPDAVQQAIITHAHADHVMAVPMFRRLFPQVTVAASELGARTLASEKTVSFFCQVDEALTGAMLKAGRITEQQRPEALKEMKIGVDRLLQEGDKIEVGGLAFNVLETPGHSECSLSFHQPDRGILIISDATGYYMPQPGQWWPNYFSGYGPYLASIERLAALDAEILCLSHNGAVLGGPSVGDYFDGVLAATRAYHARIIAETRAGKSIRDLAGELGEEIHAIAPLMPLDFFQKNCGLLVKQSLKHEG
ncbi:MAG: MBL fold metallo-hydrolase [Pirellulales bacterium]|jgi:glyoxylase-like metal-dependent hydrolase (beta-lactamase superfamily II)|nr:MBL fold metallo-hydrolase [Thermoguttaceae bacterium]MDD4788413.1 MBL fold metallo-hydrolase [Pirellulales bacterium]NLZ00208.1 MBL fold metallo-hydrolase [Pirellulaceae bacterium]